MLFSGEDVTVLAPRTEYDADRDETVAYDEQPVGNVLFGRPSTSAIAEDARHHGADVAYVLGFPKEFSGSLRGCLVRREADGEVFRVVGDPRPLPDSLCPTAWNREVGVTAAYG